MTCRPIIQGNGWLYASGGICLAAFALLGSLVVMAWRSQGGLVRLKVFQQLRGWLAIFATLFAAMTIWRVIQNLDSGHRLSSAFIPEYYIYSAFWGMAPPIWFFVEYLLVQSRCVYDAPEGYPETIKAYADYASKVWAAVLALMGALYLKG